MDIIVAMLLVASVFILPYLGLYLAVMRIGCNPEVVRGFIHGAGTATVLMVLPSHALPAIGVGVLWGYSCVMLDLIVKLTPVRNIKDKGDTDE